MASTYLFMLAQLSSPYQTFIYLSFGTFFMKRFMSKIHFIPKSGGGWKLSIDTNFGWVKIYLFRFIIISLTLNELKQFSEKFFYIASTSEIYSQQR